MEERSFCRYYFGGTHFLRFREIAGPGAVTRPWAGPPSWIQAGLNRIPCSALLHQNRLARRPALLHALRPSVDGRYGPLPAHVPGPLGAGTWLAEEEAEADWTRGNPSIGSLCGGACGGRGPISRRGAARVVIKRGLP